MVFERENGVSGLYGPSRVVYGRRDAHADCGDYDTVTRVRLYVNCAKTTRFTNRNPRVNRDGEKKKKKHVVQTATKTR